MSSILYRLATDGLTSHGGDFYAHFRIEPEEILSIAIFSAISGSILASIVAIGGVLMKPMV